jgi:hypothetical protein
MYDLTYAKIHRKLRFFNIFFKDHYNFVCKTEACGNIMLSVKPDAHSQSMKYILRFNKYYYYFDSQALIIVLSSHFIL